MDYNNTGAMKSPFSPRVRQSISGRRPIGLSSVKKNQSKYMQSSSEQAGDVIYKTPSITVETYGLPLPVMVTEVLTLGSGDVSVGMSECGWCWVVCGRRVLVWPRSLAPDDGPPLPPGGLSARELTLPQTDLAHKADLVRVFYSEGAQMASCVGVSPEGVVRYWPSVGQEGVWTDVSCELAGQECDRLVLASGALVLATTTCTLVVIEPATVEGRQSVVCRRLCPPSGWLGGIGRRVSLMFFGSMPAHAETKLVGVVGIGGCAAEPHVALVARGPVLQVWRGAHLHEHANLLDSHLHGEGVSARDVCALDVRAAGDDELLLLLALSAPRHNDRRYAIAHINICDAARPVVRTVGVAGGAWSAGGADGAGGAEPRLLPLGARALLYTHNYIALANLSGAGEVECVRVSGEAERILGAEVCRGQPLLFTRKHGVLLLSCHAHRTHHPAVCEGAAGGPAGAASAPDMYDGNLSLYEIDPHEISTVTSDACGKLKTAFLFHVRREAAACRALLAALFPARDDDGDADGVLARTIYATAAEMIDDIPAGDPRWKARGGLATNIPLGSSAALAVSAQLADKRRAFALYTEYLRAHGLLQRAGTLTLEGGVVVRCEAALCGLAERLAAAAALRDAHDAGAPYAPLIDLAIEQVIGTGSEEEDTVAEALSLGALSAADACYRRVSRVPRLLVALARAEPPHSPALHAQHALHTCTLLTTVLSEMQGVRASWGCAGAAAAPDLGPRALLPALVHLVKHALTECARACPSPSVRAQVVEAAAGLARAALLDAAPLLRHPHPAANQLYTDMRRDLILSFVEEGSTARALSLADSFRDYELLVQLCVEHAGLDTLQEYIDKYEHEGMAEIAYSWLAGRGGRYSALLCRGAVRGARLPGWLAVGPARAPLAALHALHHHRPRLAAALLAAIAADSRAHGPNNLHRATTAASLGKLCLLASSGEESSPQQDAALRHQLETQLALAEHQQALPAELRLRRGLDGEDEHILSPEEMVQMYVESEAGSLSEYDYKKALDLTDYVEEPRRRDQLRLKVWCACVLRDSWAEAASERDSPHDYMFFRLVDLVHVMGGDLELVLPPLEELVSAPELAELAASPAFHYRLKRGYHALRPGGHDALH